MNFNLIKPNFLAFGCAFCYAFGLVFFVLVFPEALNTSSLLTTYLERQTLYEIWIIIIYMVFAVAVLQLSLSLKKRDPVFNFSYTIAILWATLLLASGSIALVGIEAVSSKTIQDAQTLWEPLSVVQNALGGGTEFVGGLWNICIALPLLKKNKPLAVFGILVGIIGVFTLFSAFRDWVLYFGILQLLFFVGLGISFSIKKQ